jgi:hypothetical protein
MFQYLCSYERKCVPSLTDLSVRNLPPGLHVDTRLPSFGIRIGKSKKTWVVIKGKNRTKICVLSPSTRSTAFCAGISNGRNR